MHFEFIHEGKLNGLIQKIDNNNSQQNIILRSNRYGSKQSKTKFFGKKGAFRIIMVRRRINVLKENKKENKTKKQKVEEATIGKSALIFKSIHITFMSHLALIAFDLSAFLTEMNKTLFIY